MQVCLGIDHQDATHHLRLLCESTGVAMHMVERLANIPCGWLERYVHVSDKELLEEIGRNGAVILSHHSYHHNLMISFFKLCGLPLYPVGNPPAAFSEDDYLYQFTLRLNQATASNLNGGSWLFNSRGKEFLLGVRKSLELRKILLVFCDFNESKKTNPVLPFLGKTLQMPNGVLSLLEKECVPIYFAGFCLQSSDRYLLTLTRLQTKQDSPAAAPLGVQYLEALERHVRQHPSAWQHWEMME